MAAVVEAVRSALASEAGAHVTSLSAADIDAAEVVRAARVHRVAGLLTDQARAIGLPAAVADPLRETALRDATGGLMTARETVRAHAGVRAAGVPALVIKGVALSMQTTGSPTGRGAGDVDLLVRAADVSRAREALVGAGWGLKEGALLEPGRLWRWVSYMRREALFPGTTIDVDLHWRIGMHMRPLPATEELLTRAVSVTIGGVDVPTLSPSDALAAACMHAHLDRYARLRSLVDIVRLVRLPEAQVRPGSDAGLRRLVSDAVGMVNGLIGGITAERLVELGVSPATGRGRERALWEQSSVRPIWSSDDVALRDLPVVYGERARYSGAGPSVLMMTSDFVLPPERLRPGMGPVDVAAALGTEFGDFWRRRVLRRG